METKASGTITLASVADVDAITPYYYQQQDTILTPPTKPTVKPPPSPWQTSQPALDNTMNVYICFLCEYGNGSFDYSDVSLWSEYEASKQAYNLAYTTSENLNDNYDNRSTVEQKISDAVSAEASARALENLTKIDRFSPTGEAYHTWENNVFKVVATGDNETYSTEIGGDGIEFKHNNRPVASINQDRLVIAKTVVLDEMQVGNNKWTWKIDPDDDSIFLKWLG